MESLSFIRPVSSPQKIILVDHQLVSSTKRCVHKEDHERTLSNADAYDKEQMPASSQSPQMGASISAENVGNMLFNEDILKGGRGDVRVGSTGRWKDFKGNEIIRNEVQKSE